MKHRYTDHPEVRDEIMMFARALERQMKYNEARGKDDAWMYAKPAFLFKRLCDEAKELKAELDANPREQIKIRHESADVGSLVLFIWYNSMLIDAKYITDHSDIGGSSR